jgi:hypothetical protein
MLSRSRFGRSFGCWPHVAFLVLGVSACAGSSDMPTTGTGGNQSGNTGKGGNASGGTTGGGDIAGTTGSGGTSTGTGGSSTTGTGGSSSGTGGSATGTGGSASGTGGPATTGTGGSGTGTGGASGRGGTTGTAGAGGRGGSGGTGASAAGRGGATGTGGTTGTAGATGTGGALVWPNATSSANSDDWLVQNHDKISQLRPVVLAMDIGNTSNATTLIQRHIDGLANATSFHKYGNASAQPMLVYQLLKVVNGGSGPNYSTWNSQAFADSNIQIKDPKDPTGPNLTLCQLFEKGVINEVWCMATQNQTKCGETQETKVVYTNTDPPTKASPLKIISASNGDNITSLGCKVSTRIIDFNTSRGVGCHQHAMGHGWERYMGPPAAIPLLTKQAARFLNWDLNTRVMAPFSNFYSACNSNSAQLTNCIVWDSQIAIHSGATAATNFTIADMSGGCGNAHFYPNTTGTYSYDANTPDPMVLSSCEHYGMHDGANGKDMTTPFTNAMTDSLAKAQQGGGCAAGSPYCSTDDDCGGHGTSYLYQSFPSYGTTATNDDGSPMHNWWVYLFY